jgi:hypothetical protein
LGAPVDQFAGFAAWIVHLAAKIAVEKPSASGFFDRDVNF